LLGPMINLLSSKPLLNVSSTTRIESPSIPITRASVKKSRLRPGIRFEPLNSPLSLFRACWRPQVTTSCRWFEPKSRFSSSTPPDGKPQPIRMIDKRLKPRMCFGSNSPWASDTSSFCHANTRPRNAPLPPTGFLPQRRRDRGDERRNEPGETPAGGTGIRPRVGRGDGVPSHPRQSA